VFTEGAILFFDPFYFRNGNTAKAKYFIVLKVMDEKVVLATLPSSQDYVPATVVDADVSPCIEIPDANFNCYFLKAGRIVTTNHWAFPKNTFLYGHQLDEYEIATLQDIYPIEGIDFEHIGTLSPKVFAEIIACFRKSASVKRKYKKLL
jgi:hypothetical protein